MLAVAGGDKNLECVKQLSQLSSIDINCTDSHGNTLLHIASIYGNNDILEYLLTKKILNILERNSNGDTALSIA
jgi:ankyrin repeat protein